MTENKGVDPLLRAFAAVAARHPHVRLVLKGLDCLWDSGKLFEKIAKDISPAEMALIQPRLAYHGGLLPLDAMARFYALADAYVSPYAGEAFNLPVLEAAACGLPVICTAGGSTDDFTDPSFTLPIKAQVLPGPDPDCHHLAIEIESLAAQMLRVIEDPAYCAGARVAGPRWVSERFTWKHAVDKLLRVLLNQ